MSHPWQILKEAVAGRPPPQQYRWEELLAAMRVLVSAPPTWEAEQLLVAVLRFEGLFWLNPSSELPHSMSPEDMLRSMAIQTLVKWTGLAHLQQIQQAQATASPMLAGIARAVIERASQAIDPEEVA